MAVLTAKERVYARLDGLWKFDAEIRIARREPLVSDFHLLSELQQEVAVAVISEFSSTKAFKKGLSKDDLAIWDALEHNIRRESCSCNGISRILRIVDAREQEGREAGERAGLVSESRGDAEGD